MVAGPVEIRAVFDGSVVPKDRMVETLVDGGSVKEYGLSLFRSVRFDVDEAEFRTVTSLVLNDAAQSYNKETEIDRGRLRYAMMSFSSVRKDEDGTCSVILVYMQGETTLADLKEKIKNSTRK